jgi:hypothetical protein
VHASPWRAVALATAAEATIALGAPVASSRPAPGESCCRRELRATQRVSRVRATRPPGACTGSRDGGRGPGHLGRLHFEGKSSPIRIEPERRRLQACDDFQEVDQMTSSQPRYFSNIFMPGPVKQGDLRFTIGVVESRDRPMTIGMALGGFYDQNRWELFRLIIKGQELPGEFHLVDGEFIPAKLEVTRSGPAGSLRTLEHADTPTRPAARHDARHADNTPLTRARPRRPEASTSPGGAIVPTRRGRAAQGNGRGDLRRTSRPVSRCSRDVSRHHIVRARPRERPRG